MKSRNNYILIILGVLNIFLSVSCKKFVQIDPPRNSIITSQVFSDSLDATAAVMGIYTTAIQNSTSPSFLSGGITLFTSLASDELYPTTGNPDDNQFYTNGVSPTNNSSNSSFWSSAYSQIYQANACIEGLQSSNGISNALKNQLIGETKVYRALCYFNLVNLFGNVPLILNTGFEANATTPRTDKNLVYQAITNDLIDAQSKLPIQYVARKTIPSERIRPNKYTAMALLSRLYLYEGQWANAENITTQIINSGIYNLSSDLNKVFLSKNNTEAIWQLLPVQPGYETVDGYVFVTAPGVVPQYVISNYLLGSFEINDLRKANWLGSTNVNGQNYYYPNKYKLGRDNNTIPTEGYTVFRLSEQYLIRAEARAHLGEIPEGLSDLNVIRLRAGLPSNTSATVSDSLLTAISHERQAELFCEFGHRWFDLKRTNKVDLVLGSPGGVCAAKGGIWNTNWQLFPIPFSELQLNPFLTPNPGYQ